MRFSLVKPRAREKGQELGSGVFAVPVNPGLRARDGLLTPPRRNQNAQFAFNVALSFAFLRKTMASELAEDDRPAGSAREADLA